MENNIIDLKTEEMEKIFGGSCWIYINGVWIYTHAQLT